MYIYINLVGIYRGILFLMRKHEHFFTFFTTSTNKDARVLEFYKLTTCPEFIQPYYVYRNFTTTRPKIGALLTFFVSQVIFMVSKSDILEYFFYLKTACTR